MELISRTQWYKSNPQDKGASDCPFCNSTQDVHKEYVVWKGKYWFICHNKYPILGLTNQMMAIPYRHTILSSDLHDEEYLELKEVEKFMKDFYKEKEYFMFVREARESRSLEHIHYHFLPGRIPYDDIEIILKKQGF